MNKQLVFQPLQVRDGDVCDEPQVLHGGGDGGDGVLLRDDDDEHLHDDGAVQILMLYR